MLLERLEKGKRVQALEEKPELFEDLKWIYDGFNDLNWQRRTVVNAVSPISISEVVHWLDLNQVDDRDDRRFFSKMVFKLDRNWRDHAQAVIKAKTGSK